MSNIDNRSQHVQETQLRLPRPPVIPSPNVNIHDDRPHANDNRCNIPLHSLPKIRHRRMVHRVLRNHLRIPSILHRRPWDMHNEPVNITHVPYTRYCIFSDRLRGRQKKFKVYAWILLIPLFYQCLTALMISLPVFYRGEVKRMREVLVCK